MRSAVTTTVSCAPAPPASDAARATPIRNFFMPMLPRAFPGEHSRKAALFHVLRAADEVGHVVVDLLQRLLVRVDHVAGFVLLVLDIGLELARDRELAHLVDALVIGRREI